MTVPLYRSLCIGLSVALALCALTSLSACSDRPSVAARATVETFYTAVQAGNLPVVQDNIAAGASPQFQQHVFQAATAAQAGGAAQQAVQLVTIDTPSIDGGTAHVHVVFADGGTDTVTLTREGARWKVLSSGRLS